MCSLPKPGFDPETMRAVAVAYRRERRAGWLDGPAREAAIEAFRARHPDIEPLPASEAAAPPAHGAARTRGELAMDVHRLASIAVLAVLLAACASARTQTVAAYAGAPLPRPDRIIVYDFAVSPEEVSLDQGIGARIKREVEDKSPGAAELEAARATQAALAAALARDLQSYGLIAEHYPTGTRLPAGTSLEVQGQIVRIDQGNRTRRVLIGLGAGKSSVSADAQIYYVSAPGEPRFISAYEGSSDSGRAPGAAETMGVGAASDRLATSAALGGAMHGGGELRGTSDDANVERLATSLAKQIGMFAVSQGWIPPSAVH